MKKVLFVATVDSHIELFHLPYLKYFKESGYEVHVATSTNKKIKYCDKKIEIPIKRSPYHLSNIKSIRILRGKIKKEKYDIIHCHTPMGAVVARLAAKTSRKKGTKVIYTAHGFHFYKNAPILNWCFFYIIEKILAHYTDILITINEEDYILAKNKFKTNVKYINGIGLNIEKFKQKLTEKEKINLRKQLKIKKDDYILIYPAELSKRKNQKWLIENIDELIKNNPKIHLLLPGTDSLNGNLHKLIKELNLQNNIHLLGFRKDINQLLQISDISISTSKQEGLPVNILEAMYVNLPIIATNCRGNRDLVSKENGFLIEINDEIQLKNSINKLIENKELRIKMGNNSKKIIQKYLLPNVMNDMKKIYEEKKVLHVLTSSKYSGAENLVCNIIKNSNYKMIYLSKKGTIETHLKKQNIEYVLLNHVNIFTLYKQIKKINPDIIHAHDFKASIMCSLFNKKVISHLHQNPDFLKRWNLKSFIYYLSTKKYFKIITVSDSIINNCIFKNKIKNKTDTVYNTVSKENITKMSKNNLKNKYDLCYVGRFEIVKNPMQFIDLVYELKKRNQNIKTIMIGDGTEFNNCIDKIKKLKLSKNIKLTGFVDNPFKYINNSKIIIMPSLNEGFGLSAIEAMCLNKPVLNSGVGGLKNIFENNHEFICKNIDEYIEKIELLQNNKIYKNYQSNCKKIIKKYINTKEMMDNFNEIYKEDV